ncbi:hypothetical protein GCM10010421_56740 [Streptomyces glaucus]|uniref:Transposase IS701-like DDE domain-containing protein n=1 Tax=Streptomyces glaucus TaxID=284029 RepID=A0ABN3KDT5_9ACTN
MARQYCGAVGKRANCQVAVSVHAATDTASCPLNWESYLPREWTDAPERCRGAGVPDEVAHQEKRRPALGLLDTLGEGQLKAPVVVADAATDSAEPNEALLAGDLNRRCDFGRWPSGCGEIR